MKVRPRSGPKVGRPTVNNLAVLRMGCRLNRAHRVSIKRSGMQGHLEKQVGRGAKRGTGVLGGAGGAARAGQGWAKLAEETQNTHTQQAHIHNNNRTQKGNKITNKGIRTTLSDATTHSFQSIRLIPPWALDTGTPATQLVSVPVAC